MPRAKVLTEEEKQNLRDRYFLKGDGLRQIHRETGHARQTVNEAIFPQRIAIRRTKHRKRANDRYRVDADFRVKVNARSVEWARKNRDRVNKRRRAWRVRRKALGLPC